MCFCSIGRCATGSPFLSATAVRGRGLITGIADVNLRLPIVWPECIRELISSI